MNARAGARRWRVAGVVLVLVVLLVAAAGWVLTPRIGEIVDADRPFPANPWWQGER